LGRNGEGSKAGGIRELDHVPQRQGGGLRHPDGVTGVVIAMGFEADPQHSFPGHGPEQLEIAQLKREVTKLKAERDILKNARRSLSSCGHRNGLRYVLSAPRGAAVGFLVASTP
jgi:hypothetical protein